MTTNIRLLQALADVHRLGSMPANPNHRLTKRKVKPKLPQRNLDGRTNKQFQIKGIRP